MSISNRLKLALNEKGMTQAELSRRANISRSTLSEWLSGKYEPKQDKVFLLADALGVSPSWLMGVSDSAEPHMDIGEIYDRLTKPNQEKVYSYAESLLEDQQTIYLVGQTAAGPAVTYGDASYDMIMTNVPDGADYALNVQGDSMAPLINDKDIVFVKEQSMVENGEIAIIEIDGNEVTCKKFYKESGKVILKSINEKYDDMVFEDGIKIIGKVIR